MLLTGAIAHPTGKSPARTTLLSTDKTKGRQSPRLATRIRMSLEINKPLCNAFAFTFVRQQHRIIAAPFLKEGKVTF